MYLRSISKVDDVNMEYSMHFTFREEWIDERLLFYSDNLDHIVLSPDRRIWLPDTFFQNEKSGKKHMIDAPNIMLRVYNGTGRILYSCRLTLTLSCPMHLAAYPLDTQTCYIDYASYAYTTADIEYYWKEGDPIQIKPGLKQSLPSFVLSDIKTGNCTSVTNTGVTVLLTITTMASGINANLPPVSYTKSCDIWIGVSTGFIFGALLEFALVNWAARKDARRRAFRMRRRPNPLLGIQQEYFQAAAYNNNNNHSSVVALEVDSGPRSTFLRWWSDLWNVRYKEKSRRIDLLARILFPLFFLIFNMIYWWVYLTPYLAVQDRVDEGNPYD
ncbi:glutamate-gated chloride channel [Aphelenchoides avenae]|nr:glutamate-gated chloride channel [Aphelenchus avenae]